MAILGLDLIKTDTVEHDGNQYVVRLHRQQGGGIVKVTGSDSEGKTVWSGDVGQETIADGASEGKDLEQILWEAAISDLKRGHHNHP